ncbi:MAG: hypothetical protein WC758_08225 [Candidatus Woesearchaeota archaeon]|jgi:hypothetical protein
MRDEYEQQTPQQFDYKTVPVSSDELYANAIQEDRIKNIIAQLDPENQLKEIEMRIRGYKKNVFTGSWEKIDEDSPEPPKLLIMRFISYVSSVMNQNTTQSNLSENQVNNIMGLVINYVSDELDSNAKIYDLENNYTERTRIAHIVLNSIFFVLNRALNGQEAKRMWKAMSLTENFNQQPQKSKLSQAMQFWK